MKTEARKVGDRVRLATPFRKDVNGSNGVIDWVSPRDGWYSVRISNYATVFVAPYEVVTNCD